MNTITTFSKETIEQFAHTFESLFYDSDAAGMATYYTDNARLFADGVNPIQGRDVIEKFWQATCIRGKATNMKRSIRVDEIQAANDLCYAYSTLELEFTANGQTMHRTVSDITIWRKQADDSWLIEIDISVPDPQTSES